MKQARETGYYSPQYIERVNKIRRDFVANVSHELKTTPATSLRLLAESLEEVIDEDPIQARVFAGQLRSETERLSQLIVDLLDLARLESAEDFENPERVDVRGILMGILGRARRVARKKNINLNWRRFGKAADYTVYGDETQLTSMFNNLVGQRRQIHPARREDRGDRLIRRRPGNG